MVNSTLQAEQAIATRVGRRCGAISRRDASVFWRVWAPKAEDVRLVLFEGNEHRVLAMRPEGQGFFYHEESDVPDGQRYAYRLDGSDNRQDPCSLWQPSGVPGPSAVVRTDRFEWSDHPWRGVEREELVFYELHVGTFTPQGTFEAVIPRLAALRELGVTALQIMPVAQFPGTRNWGYDGVLPYAAQNSYGGPHGLVKLVDAAHAAGLAVFLDVVYNHLGPEANYLHEFGPYFTDKYQTPWGKAVNYDDRGCDAVRDYVLDNARMWLDEFHVDGLRLDAVHAIYDLGARHVLAAVKQVAQDVATSTGRTTHVVGESDLNDPRVLYPPERGGHGLDAQWSDDFHHAVHAFLTGERQGYYADYGSAEQLAAVLNTPFLNPWGYSAQRGRRHGAPPDGLSGDRFVVCTQNHDQVGNRAAGDRLSTLLGSPAKQRLAACLTLFSPYLPLLFMGEEYGETRPFPFFCSFNGPELVRAVREGRKREFADFVRDAADVPDPDAPGTFQAACLSWSWPSGGTGAGLRRMYGDLLTARRQWPALRDFTTRAARLLPEGRGAGVLELVRGGTSADAGGAVRVLFNLGDVPHQIGSTSDRRRQVLFSSEAASYAGGRGAAASSVASELMPFECVAIGPADWPAFG